VGGSPANGPAKGKPTHTMNAQNDPSGVDCMAAGCHQTTFAFAGTLYGNADGSTRVAGAEITVADPTGKVFATALSDPDGNFWIASTGSPMPANSHVGARNATTQKIMSGSAAAGCNGAGACHGNATFRLVLN
jgi:hypothetical protein